LEHIYSKYILPSMKFCPVIKFLPELAHIPQPAKVRITLALNFPSLDSS
jgi:hypothetical protein